MNRDNRFVEYLVRLGGLDCHALECDFDYFEKNFWTGQWVKTRLKELMKRSSYSRENREKLKEITPMVVWTEIISVIKGSSQAYSKKGRCLGL